MLKVSWKDIYTGSQYTVFENKLSFMKKVILHIFTLIQYKARQVLYAIDLVLTREMTQE